jgi:hypothetical protein
MSETPTVGSEEIKVAENPAVEAAKESGPNPAMEWHTFSTGVRGKLKAVAPALITTVVSKLKEPPVPLWHNPEKDRDEENPADPNYLMALDEYNNKRGTVTIDALAMFGVDLQDPLPEDEMWLYGLKVLGIDVDVNDKIAKTFAYKRYIAVGQPELNVLMAMFAGEEKGIAAAMRSFRR